MSRIKEELELLPKEMRAHLSYYRRLASRLTQLQTILAADAAPAAEQLAAAGYTQLRGLGRYQPSVESIGSDSAVRSGVLTYVGLAQFEVQHLLTAAVKAFSKAGLVVVESDPAAAAATGSDGDGVVVDSEDSEDGDLAAPSDDFGDVS